MLADLAKGKKAVGLRAVTKAMEKDQVLEAFVAGDADMFIRAKIETFCNEKRIRLTPVATMEELGKACGIDVGASAAALLK